MKLNIYYVIINKININICIELSIQMKCKYMNRIKFTNEINLLNK